jgi:hypothetical protein
MKRMLLRHYSREDLEAILALHRSAKTGLKIGISDSEEEADLRAIEQVYFKNGGEFLVGLLEGAIIAMGGFQLPAG